MIRAWLERLGRDTVLRIALLLAVSVVVGALCVDWGRAPQERLVAGDLAPRTVKTPVTFRFQDLEAFERERGLASSAEVPVFVHQPESTEDILIRVRTAFANARSFLSSSGDAADRELVHENVLAQLRRDLRVQLLREDVSALVEAGFPVELEEFTLDLLREGMGGMILTDRSDLPIERGEVRVIALGDAVEERLIPDIGAVPTAQDVRQRVSLRALESKVGATAGGQAATGIARSLVRANLSYSATQTAERRDLAVQAVRVEAESVRRGTVLFREGDTLTPRQVLLYEAMQAQQGQHVGVLAWASASVFLVLLLSAAYGFGVSTQDRFSTRLRDVASAAVLLILVAGMARLSVVSGEEVALLVGYEAEASSVWFVVPVAGAVMLVRMLMGLSWAMLFTGVAAVVGGLVMHLQALPVAYFLISGLTAAAAGDHARERIGVLRVGLQVALVNAAAVLAIHFLQLYGVDGEITLATTMRPVWSMAFAIVGGIASAFLVLGLIPLFETFGFVTDYRLMELANLNHPLMRQLMLRAPGSYHHSVMVGSLAEAAAEEIGANALQAKVASYFHDIGKATKPQFFVENQGNGGNRHLGLDPYTSAQIIISHVTEGGRMAVEHKLPKPIVDNIWMHHGTGILQYFYAKAREEHGDIDEAPFRYPGPTPDTREAGIIMLADKVEAATRTIKSPTEDNIRAMISRIVSSVMSDGQFARCPLTFQEIHTIAETFVKVLVSIYHQRIEYPQTAEISSGAAQRPPPVPKEARITLDLHPGQAQAPVHAQDELEPDPDTDATPAPAAAVAQGQQRFDDSKPPVPVARRAHRAGDELPPPITAAPDGALGELPPDYESVQYLPRGDR